MKKILFRERARNKIRRKMKNMARTRRSIRNVIGFWNRNSFFERVSYFLFFMPSQYKFYRDGILSHSQKEGKRRNVISVRNKVEEYRKQAARVFLNWIFWKRFRSIYNFLGTWWKASTRRWNFYVMRQL